VAILHRSVGLFAAIALCACGSLPPGVKKAERQFAKGDFGGAEKTAVLELKRYPKHPTLWRVRVQAAMGDRDNVRAAKLYEQWYGLREQRHDRGVLRVMAMTMMWQGLRVPSATVRTRTIQAVERLELEDLADDVSLLITNDDDRVAAAAAIAMLKADPSAGRVAADSLTSNNVQARIIAIRGVGRKVGAKTRADIVARFKDDNASVRMAAVTVVGNFASEKDTPRLMAMAVGDAEGSVRATALRALRKGKRKGLLAAATTALKDKYLGARLAGVELLGHLGSGTRSQLKALAGGADLFVALRAITVLGTHAKHSDISKATSKALTNTSWEIRVAAINTLSSAAYSKANRASQAIALLTDKQVDVRIAAARALLDTQHRPAAISALAAALTDGNDSVRLQAARNLVRAKDPRGIQTIAALLKSSSASTRAAAISAHVGARTITLALVRALADESAELRIQAAEALLTI